MLETDEFDKLLNPLDPQSKKTSQRNSKNTSHGARISGLLPKNTLHHKEDSSDLAKMLLGEISDSKIKAGHQQQDSKEVAMKLMGNFYNEDVHGKNKNQRL